MTNLPSALRVRLTLRPGRPKVLLRDPSWPRLGSTTGTGGELESQLTPLTSLLYQSANCYIKKGENRPADWHLLDLRAQGI